MGKLIPNIGGGGGVTSDELTADASKVLDGYSYVGNDTNDESGIGGIPLKEAATYYATTSDQTIDAEQYLNGAQIIKGLTQTNLVAANIIKDKTITIYNGNANVWSVTGTLDVQSILSFSAAPYSSNQITFTWKNPAKGAFSGVIIRGKTGSYPTSVTDGTQWYKGSGNNSAANGTSTAIVSGFTAGTTYYFRAFSYAIKNNADWVASTTYTATATTTAKGTKTFTSTTTWTVPTGVRSIDIFCVGGGGGSGGSYCGNKSSLSATGGGGGGYTKTKTGYAVTPGATFTVTIGAGGAGGQGYAIPTDNYGRTGGTTSFGSVLSAAGGVGSAFANNSSLSAGGKGGSGGGGASFSSVYNNNGQGGSDGSAGIDGLKYGAYKGTAGGAGQGTTTRAFGSSSGTLYAGGGGGGIGGEDTQSAQGGTGGSGGGGNSATEYRTGSNGSANTGGGGGGSYSYGNRGFGPVYSGGSGICIVRWGY